MTFKFNDVRADCLSAFCLVPGVPNSLRMVGTREQAMKITTVEFVPDQDAREKEVIDSTPICIDPNRKIPLSNLSLFDATFFRYGWSRWCSPVRSLCSS